MKVENQEQTRFKTEGIIFIICPVVFLAAGMALYPWVFPVVSTWNCYRAYYYWFHILGILGEGIMVTITIPLKLGTWAANWKNRWKSTVVILLLIITCISSFATGLWLRNKLIEEFPEISTGDTVQLPDLTESIWIDIIFEDGREAGDADTLYIVTKVKEKPLSFLEKVFGLHFQWLDRLRGTTPQIIVLREAEMDSQITVRFADPLISSGTDVVYWHFDRESCLLGDQPTESGGKDFAAYFSWSVDGVEWTKCPIDSVEKQISCHPESGENQIAIRWENEWTSLSRQMLNFQEYWIEAGSTGYFYYPGERYLLHSSVLKESPEGGSPFEKMSSGAGRFALEIESMQEDVILSGSGQKPPIVLADDLDACPPYMVKAGEEIVYHCYAGAKELGYYYVSLDRTGEMVWNVCGTDQEALMVLRLAMSAE